VSHVTSLAVWSLLVEDGVMILPSVSISSTPHTRYLIQVPDLLRATKFFHPYEIDVAIELVQEALNKGEESGYLFLFAEQENKLLGYSCYGHIPLTLHSYDIYWMGVDVTTQGQGIGQRLMQATESHIDARGGRRIYVETSGRDLYHRTNRFYQRQGYLEEARLKDFYAPLDDKIVYSKVLR